MLAAAAAAAAPEVDDNCCCSIAAEYADCGEEAAAAAARAEVKDDDGDAAADDSVTAGSEEAVKLFLAAEDVTILAPPGNQPDTAELTGVLVPLLPLITADPPLSLNPILLLLLLPMRASAEKFLAPNEGDELDREVVRMRKSEVGVMRKSIPLS